MPQSLPGDVNTSSRESSITITHDGKRIYFSSNRIGGIGTGDIYYADKDKNGRWSKAINLGPGINTEADEESPFIDSDGKTLYFSSQGGKGMGGYDIFRARLLNVEKNEWSKPENLGYPINTPDNDAFYVVSKDGKRGYYSSVRDDGFGYSDIYMITVPEPKVEPVVAKKEEPVQPRKYTLYVKDAKDGNPLDVKVNLQGATDKVVVGQVRKQTGQYEFSITEKEPKIYQLSIEASGYAFINQPVRIKGSAGDTISVVYKVDLRKLEVGVTKALHNIYFNSAMATFKAESYNELNKLEHTCPRNE